MKINLLVNRGETFRKLISRIGEIRSLISERVNVMALTATATTKLRREVAYIIGLNNELVHGFYFS